MSERQHKRAKVESDDESTGSLKDFIVDESEMSDEPDVDVMPVKIKAEDFETLSLLAEEAERFASGVKGSVVAGRVLRSRKPEDIEKRKTKDLYYERFGREEEERLMEKFNKKDTVEFIKKLEKDHRADYESAGHVWPNVSVKMTLEAIRAAYVPLKKFLDLPDSDASDSESDSSASTEESDGEESDESEAEESEAEESESDADGDESDAEDSNAEEE